MLNMLKNWGSKYAQAALDEAIKYGRYEIFKMCHDRGGRVSKKQYEEMRRGYDQRSRSIYKSADTRLGDLKAIIDSCREWEAQAQAEAQSD